MDEDPSDLKKISQYVFKRKQELTKGSRSSS